MSLCSFKNIMWSCVCRPEKFYIAIRNGLGKTGIITLFQVTAQLWEANINAYYTFLDLVLTKDDAACPCSSYQKHPQLHTPPFQLLLWYLWQYLTRNKIVFSVSVWPEIKLSVKAASSIINETNPSLFLTLPLCHIHTQANKSLRISTEEWARCITRL